MRRILPRVVALVLAISSMAVAPAAAANPPRVSADLEGVPITVAEIADHYCHDGDYPSIHCFATPGGLEAALDARNGAASGEAVTATTYVTVYSGTYYGGSYFAISQDYDTLATVGWNDRIRSFRGLNSELGRFWTDWFHSGSYLDFCCNSNVPSLSATFDQKITSVYRR